MEHLLRWAIAAVVVVGLSCEVGCGSPPPPQVPPPPQDEATEAANKLAADAHAMIEAYKAQVRQKFCPKP